MNIVNYDKKMAEIIAENKSLGVRPTLLLHACCAPCSTSVIERLKEDFLITVFFYNPNMDTEEEYLLRLNEQKKLCDFHKISLIEFGYNKQEFLRAIEGKGKEKEGGARCFICYKLRLEKASLLAKEKGFDYFTTTLTVSPLKNTQKLNEIGTSLQEEVGVKFLPSDFKKKNGYARSIELSKEFNLYRQNYCGCEFSKREI